MTLYVLVPKCSRPCGVFTIWLSVHQALWTPLPLKQHFAELQATTFSEDLPSHFSGHSGVLCCPVPPYALCFMWFLTAWPSTPLFSLQGLCLGPPSTPTPPNASWELMSLKLLQPSSSSCAPQPCIRWTPRSQQVPDSACPLTSTSPVSVSGRPQEPACQARTLAIILEDKTTLSCQAYLLNVSDTTLFLLAPILVHSSLYNRIPRLNGL